MNKTFKVPLMKEWTLLDDRIVIGGKKEVLFKDVTRIDTGEPKNKTGNGVIQLWVPDKTMPYMVCYAYKDKEEGAEAARFIQEKYLEAHQDIIDEATKEHRMRCNVCGHVFCYSELDVMENERLAKQAKSSAKAGMWNAFFGNSVDTQASINRAERTMDKIKDFSRCPKCNSTNLTELRDNEPSIAAAPAAAGCLTTFLQPVTV